VAVPIAFKKFRLSFRFLLITDLSHPHHSMLPILETVRDRHSISTSNNT
jgi:hypothetical protein